MEQQKPTQETHPDAESTPAAGGDAAVETQTGLSLDDINAITGRDYKDLDTAKESLKEMQKMASQAAQKPKEEPLQQKPSESNAEYEARLAKLENDNFFARHQDHEANRSLLEKIAKADGISLAEAAESTEYKAIFEAQQTAAQTQSKRTVAEPNNRVSQGTPNEEPPQPGDRRGAAEFVAAKFFTSK